MIAPAGPADVPACRALFEEYQRGLGVSLCFQGFDRELAALPGDYTPPRGGLWIAREDGEPVGCVALRPLTAEVAELKRLYVRPAQRGRSLGRRLALEAIGAARRAGYREIRLDTLPAMAHAQALYERLGFRDTAPYNDNPVGGVRFMALALEG
ncbi:MAG TPA: GNAT family N-acetyltransferase [Usitatibacter sp.]|nr:GNAT family N-acetyltransferase [Usitatibacter sp.]